ncbi:hypothetical protein PIB30_014755 [Stylosanthes scabra]|uniref:Uncharacterized protein n=1 Tax=Stylosanthes scabra TaxID=79078 RepID=A0ABU6X5R1_9FABA|nr:hypothetical protein [Stylosanthes scabra]
MKPTELPHTHYARFPALILFSSRAFLFGHRYWCFFLFVEVMLPPIPNLLAVTDKNRIDTLTSMHCVLCMLLQPYSYRID